MEVISDDNGLSPDLARQDRFRELERSPTDDRLIEVDQVRMVDSTVRDQPETVIQAGQEQWGTLRSQHLRRMTREGDHSGRDSPAPRLHGSPAQDLLVSQVHAVERAQRGDDGSVVQPALARTMDLHGAPRYSDMGFQRSPVKGPTTRGPHGTSAL